MAPRHQTLERGNPGSAFALAAACCRPGGDARDIAVRAAAIGVDWPAFEAVAARHRIEGLAQEALSAAGVAPAPETADRLRRTAGEVAIAGLRLAAESVRLQTALDHAEVAALVLKGATLDALAWGRIGLKRAWDIDLLVCPRDAPRARGVLEALGYALGDPADPTPEAFSLWIDLSKECVFRHATSGLIVELHWRATDAATLLPGLSARSPAQTVTLAPGLACRTLADADLFAYLCVHGASHAWSRLKWLADLNALLTRREPAARETLYRLALARGAGTCPALALRLCADLFDLALPDALRAEVFANPRARRLAVLALDALTHGGGRAEIDTRPLFAERILLSHFLFAEGWRFLLAEAARQAVSIDDHLRLRLPRPLAFLYPVLRAPLWLWRRLVRRIRRS